MFDQKEDATGCGPSTFDLVADDAGKFIPLLPGLGNHHYTIATQSDSTQIYFDQGLRFYYGYHFREALASFREAARFDKNCPMAYWGQALAMGPYYNNSNYKMGKDVPAVLTVLRANATSASGKELDLINAMLQRYSADSTNADRPRLDSNYATAMNALVEKYSADNDIKALYIDAVMLQHKWNLWNTDGSPKPWTPPLVQLCEAILKTDTAQPAALHYYIHLTEASRQPALALHSAEILQNLMPGVGHMVHMATHSYQRNGLFAKAVTVNEDANNAYNLLDAEAPALHTGQNNVVHVYAVQSYCAINAGMYQKALPLYQRARERLMAQHPAFARDVYSQFVYMIPVIAMVRAGKWEEILQQPTPHAEWKYAQVLDGFARGLAYVHNNNISEASQCLAALEENIKDSLLAIRMVPFNKPVQCGRIAAYLLQGEILYAEGKSADAITAFQQAVTEEAQLVYREPQDWFIPARQFLGAYLLKLHKFKEAANVYRDDLVANPNNGWSLLGMYQSLVAQNKLREAATYQTAYKTAFASTDVQPEASVF